MIKLILTKLWPALIPIIGYMLWKIVAKKRARKNLPPPLCSQPERLTIYATLILLLGCFGYMVFSIEENRQTYHPSRVENGQITPSHVSTP